LEPAQLGDVAQYHVDTDLVRAQAERHRVHLQSALDRAREPELAMRDVAPVDPAALAERLVQLRVADHLQERLALPTRRVEAAHGPGPLAHPQDDVAAG